MVRRPRDCRWVNIKAHQRKAGCGRTGTPKATRKFYMPIFDERTRGPRSPIAVPSPTRPTAAPSSATRSAPRSAPRSAEGPRRSTRPRKKPEKFQ
jgi:hypothetical protein